jgi:hypothetical protein
MRALPAVAVALVAAAATASHATALCTEPGWASHQLELLATQPTSVINSTSLPDSFFGVEGGHIVAAGTQLFTVITEFNAPPLWVPSRIALWRASAGEGESWPTRWTRVRTLFTSGGKTDCADPRASLGSSAALAWNATTDRYEVYYVGFVSCNDTSFVNRKGRIYRAVADATGVDGLTAGSFTDAGVVLQPEVGGQSWEGTQGTDSMQPYYLGEGKGWAAFYGSAGVTPAGINPGQQVGLVLASSLSGPWRRAEHNPVNLSAFVRHIEQPMVTRLADGSFAAVFDALDHEGKGMIGYAWSRDGLRWLPDCSQLLDVVGGGGGGGGGGASAGSAAPWANATGRARTPQGLVEIGGGQLLLGFSAYDHSLPPHYSLPSQKGAANADHESMGMARLRFTPRPV